MEAHIAGAVMSASVLVNLAAFDDAVRCARAAPGLGTGLHFNIVLGRPLARASSLVDARTGAFLPLGRLARRAFAGRVRPGDVYAECAAQLERMRAAGLRTTHVDGHRHAHVLPGIWPAVVRAASDAGISIVRVPLEPLAYNAGNAVATAKKLALAASWRLATRRTRAVRAPDRFIGISLQGGQRFAERVIELLRRLPRGTTELMVHPGHDDAELRVLDSYHEARERELEALTSSAVRAALHGVELADFGDL